MHVFNFPLCQCSLTTDLVGDLMHWNYWTQPVWESRGASKDILISRVSISDLSVCGMLLVFFFTFLKSENIKLKSYKRT